MTVKPSSPARLLKAGAVVLVSGAALLLLGAFGALYFWKGSANHVSPEAHGEAGAPGLLARPLLGGPRGCCPLGGLPGTSSLRPSNSTTWLPTGGQLCRKASLGFRSGVAGGCSGRFQGGPSREGASQPGAPLNSRGTTGQARPLGLAFLTPRKK